MESKSVNFFRGLSFKVLIKEISDPGIKKGFNLQNFSPAADSLCDLNEKLLSIHGCPNSGENLGDGAPYPAITGHCY